MATPKIETIAEWLSPDYRRMMTERALLKEVFMYDAYEWLAKELRPNTTLYDLGAAVGDTAIYFSKIKEIKRVYSYEISKQMYEWARDNISKARYKDKITLYNMPACIPRGLPKNTAIKCDIEGAEHQIFTDDTDLDNVYKVQMECHKGIRELKKILEMKGFKVKTDERKLRESEEIGMIHAWR